jgi:hypothetical protein
MMPDPRDPTPDPAAATATAVAAPPDRGAADDGPDPLASLHKMSTTAGITSQEYVAINIPSIITVLVGLASLLAVISPLLLVVPVAGVILGFVSLSQIRASNGTQTGRAFAWAGIVLSLAIGAAVLVSALLERSRTAADRAEIVSQIEQLGRHVAAREYDQAYAMFSPRFQNRVNKATFDGTWDQSQKVSGLGKIVSMEWNRTSILFQDEPESGTRVATAYAWVTFAEGKEKARHPLIFRKSGGTWTIDDAPQIFPVERRSRRR